MAEVIPFRGIVYNQQRITDLAAVCTPPYDVISPEEQERFYTADLYNVIRLILGRTSDSDTAADNRYTRAGRNYHAWLAEGILVRDETAGLLSHDHRLRVGRPGPEALRPHRPGPAGAL